MTIDNLEIQIKSSSEQASQGISKLAASLTTLKQVAKGGAGLTSIANQLTKLNNALAGFNAPAGKIQSIVSSLNQLSSVQKASGLSSVTRQLKKLPEITQSLQKADMGKFAKEINKVTAAIKPLATEMDKVSRGFSSFPSKIQKVAQSGNALSASTSKSKGSFGFNLMGGLKLGIAVASARMIGNAIGGWVQKSNEYVENLNLFTVSLGEYAEEAKDYAETVGELMGIDPSDWLRAQGIFNTLATGFGVTSDKAAIMSKNLTQLSYDLSSFYNITVSDAMTKLQSAFSGELEPVRRLGYDLSQTKLQAIAASKGITKNVADMNQAEKSMLRYYALMTQVTTAQGDMARTLNTPANQLRIFNAQLEQAKRALGNIFIPAINAVLPYLIAFLKILRTVANEIAMFFGFELPKIDYSNVNGIGDGVAENLDEANASAKKLKNTVTGIDELNIIGNDANDGSGNGAGGVGFDLEVPEYDFLEGLTDSKSNQIVEKVNEKFKPLLETFQKFKDIDLSNLTKSLKKFKKSLDPLLKMTWTGFKNFIDEVIYPLTKWTVEEALPKFFDTLSGTLGILTTVLEKLSPVIKTWWENYVKPIADFAADKFIDFWGKLNVKLEEAKKWLEETTIFEDLQRIYEDLAIVMEPITRFLMDFVFWIAEIALDERALDVKYFFEDLEDVIGLLADLLDGDFKSAWEHMEDLMINNKIDKAKEKFQLLNEKIDEVETNLKNSFSEENLNEMATNFGKIAGRIAEKLITIKSKFQTWVDEEIKPLFTKEKWEEILKGIWEGMTSTMEKVMEWFTVEKWQEAGRNLYNGLAGNINGAIDGLQNLLNAAINFFNKIIDGYNSIAEENPLMNPLSRIQKADLSQYKIKTFATGGFPTAGSMFIAGEAGAELVGNIGGRTAVANQDQITEGIAQAVYNAMMSANQSGGNQNINLFIDGKQVNAAVEKAKREKGTSIMTGGLIYG